MPRKGKGKDFERPHLDDYLQSVTFKEFITAMGENRPIIMIFTNTTGNVKSVVYKEVMPGKFNTPKPMDTIGMQARTVIENLMNKERADVAEKSILSDTEEVFSQSEVAHQETMADLNAGAGIQSPPEDDGNVHVGTWVEFEDSDGRSAQGRIELIAPDESTFSIRRRDGVFLVVQAERLRAIVPHLAIERQNT